MTGTGWQQQALNHAAQSASVNDTKIGCGDKGVVDKFKSLRFAFVIDPLLTHQLLTSFDNHPIYGKSKRSSTTDLNHNCMDNRVCELFLTSPLNNEIGSRTTSHVCQVHYHVY